MLSPAVALTPLALLATGGCGKSNAAKADAKTPQAVAIDVAPARTDSVQRTAEVVGTLFGEEDATISNKVNGKIIEIYVDVGDRVKPGQPLAQLLKNDYLLDINQKRALLQEVLAKLGLSELPGKDFTVENLPSVRRAKLQAVNAESRYNRGKQLHEQKPPLLSDQDFEDLRTALEVARSAYDTEVLTAKGLLGEASTRHADVLVAEQALRDTTVRAPSERYAPPAVAVTESADPEAGDRAPAASPPATTQPAAPPPPTRPTSGSGTAAGATPGSADRTYVVAARLGNVGELARAITPLFRLEDDDPLKLRAAVPERYFPEIALGQKVTVRVEAYNRPFEGVVTRINPQVDAANRTFPIEVVVPNPEHVLPPGAFARASVQTRVEPGVVFVPASAVVTFAGVDKVYVVKDGKAQEVAVALGDRRGDEIEVRKGLTGTETVATSGTSRLATGIPVQVKDKPASRPAVAVQGK
jgi:multidrug efflux pump subunit AcrA (membrane-fusion protein)